MAREAGEAMGKHVIDAADGPGFIVNRCNRPFGLEALRAVQDGLATPEQVDRICRMAGGFRMGPFELMDLVGLDVGLAVSRSFYEQSFGEPRWRPSPLVARRVAAGHLGRKAGRGWYEYPPGRPADPEPGPVTVSGLDELRARAAEGGQDLTGVSLLPPLGRLVEVTGDVPSRSSASSPRSACTSSASATPCSLADRRPARQRGVLRARRGRPARPRTSTPGWCSASTTRAGRSPGAT